MKTERKTYGIRRNFKEPNIAYLKWQKIARKYNEVDINDS